MPTPPTTPTSSLTPAQLAKAALKRLAEQRLEPTPDNYRKAYEAESGVPSQPDKPADKAAAPNEALQDTDDGERWSSLITRMLRGAERGGRQWTTARKKDSLKRVLEGSKSSATRLHQRLNDEGRILTRDWSLYDANHVVYRPKPFTPDQLLENYFRVFRDFYSCSSVLKRLWGAQSQKNFFYPMNFGFRQSIRKLAKAYERGRRNGQALSDEPRLAGDAAGH